MRRLLVIPIIHSQTDLGSLADTVNQTKTASFGSERVARAKRSIEQFWHELSQCLEAMQLDYGRLLIYQDGLPTIENAALQLERKIVEELARNGSPNHQLVKSLMDRGAGLVGSESAALLMKEYAAIRESLARGFRDATDSDEKQSSSASSPGEPPLIEQRDRFIAQRIDETLGNQQLGILFIGMLHRVESYLPADIAVEFPVGKPQRDLADVMDS